MIGSLLYLIILVFYSKKEKILDSQVSVVLTMLVTKLKGRAQVGTIALLVVTLLHGYARSNAQLHCPLVKLNIC